MLGKTQERSAQSSRRGAACAWPLLLMLLLGGLVFSSSAAAAGLLPAIGASQETATTQTEQRALRRNGAPQPAAADPVAIAVVQSAGSPAAAGHGSVAQKVGRALSPVSDGSRKALRITRGTSAGAPLPRGALAAAGAATPAETALLPLHERASQALGHADHATGAVSGNLLPVLPAPARPVLGALVAGSGAAVRLARASKGAGAQTLGGLGTYPPPLAPGAGGGGPQGASASSLLGAPGGSCRPGGAFGCIGGGVEELMMQRYGAGGPRMLSERESVRGYASALGPLRRARSLGSVSYRTRLRSSPLSAAASSPPGLILHGPLGAVTGAPGLAVTTMLVLAALLLLGAPRSMRRLSLVGQRWIAASFALVPERPG